MAITRAQQAKQLLAQGGRTGFRMGSDEGNVSGRQYDAPSTTAKAPPSMGFGNPPSDSGGGDNNKGGNNLQKVANVVGTVSDLNRAKNLIEGGGLKALSPDPLSLGGILLFNYLKNRNKEDDQVSLMNNLDDNPMLVAELTEKQKELLDQRKGMYPDVLGAQEMLNFIESENDPDSPATIEDVKTYLGADGGRVAAMGGGIMGGLADGQMDEMGRQMYGLGKLVKKVTRAVKKVVKSPIGKAALLYVGAGGLGNLAAGKSFFAGKGIGGLFKPTQFLSNVGSIFSKPGLENIMSKARLGKFVTSGGSDLPIFQKNLLGKVLTSPGGMITATSLLPLLGIGTGDETEEEAKQLIADNTGLNFDELRPQGAMRFAADGGLMRLGYQEGGDAEPVAKKTMPLIDMDGKEKDYRETGGFVDMGRMERADDVPARLYNGCSTSTKYTCTIRTRFRSRSSKTSCITIRCTCSINWYCWYLTTTW
jgi:hypothetical protein